MAISKYKGDRWDSNPQQAESQSAALPIVLRPQSEERDSNPQPLVSDTSMLPLQHLQKMEPVGFEPTTPCLQGKCSSNWSYDPLDRGQTTLSSEIYRISTRIQGEISLSNNGISLRIREQR